MRGMTNRPDVKRDQKLWKNPVIMSLFDKREDKEYFEAMFIVENMPGVLHNISEVIGAHNVNILSGFHSLIEELGGVWVVFLEMTASTPYEELFKEIEMVSGVTDVKYVKLRKADYFDSFFFPLAIPGTRVIIITQEAFNRIKSQLVDILGTGGETILFSEGAAVGRTIYEFIPEALTSAERKLEFIENLLRATGWGLVEFNQINIARRSGEIHVKDNMEADVKYGGRCHFMRGALTSILRGVLNDSAMNLIETACIGQGDERCVFKLV